MKQCLICALLILLLTLNADSKDYYVSDETVVVGQHLTDVYYKISLSHGDESISLKKIEIGNGKVDIADFADDESTCRDLSIDRSNSKYSDDVEALLCDNFDNAKNIVEDYDYCAEKLSSTHNEKYAVELLNKAGESLTSAELEYDVKKTCFECPDEGDEGKTRGRCQTYDRFDITLILPFHENASKFVVYKIGVDGGKKIVASASVAQYRNRVIHSSTELEAE